jgi:hypothetical protein
VALFLLAGGAFACLTLMLQASLAQQQTSLGLQAVRVGQHCQAAVHSWAQDSSNFVSGNLYNDVAVEVAEFEGMQARIRMAAAPQSLLSPNSSLEAIFGSSRRELAGLHRPFSVQLRWGTRWQQQLTLHDSCAAPLRSLKPAPTLQLNQVAGSPPPMAINATAQYQAQLQDNLNQEIPGLTFRWKVLPEFVAASSAGAASLDLSLDRTGRTVWLIHHYYAGDPAVPSVAGWIRLRAECRYGGVVHVYDTDPILLQ